MAEDWRELMRAKEFIRLYLSGRSLRASNQMCAAYPIKGRKIPKGKQQE